MDRTNRSNPRYQRPTRPLQPGSVFLRHQDPSLRGGGVQFYRQPQPRQTSGTIIVPAPARFLFNFNHLPSTLLSSSSSSSSLALSPTPIFYHHQVCVFGYFVYILYSKNQMSGIISFIKLISFPYHVVDNYN